MAIVGPCQAACGEILQTARRYARSEDEAWDLVQDAVSIALARGFDDWPSEARRRWLRGVVRKRAAFVARGEGRRRRREQLALGESAPRPGQWTWEPRFLASLPPSLRAVAVLASVELTAVEIRWLLGLSDTALRKRLSALRQAVRAAPEPPTEPAPLAEVSLGPHRAQLLTHLRRSGVRAVAAHDPDGHVIFLAEASSQKAPPRQP